MESIAIIDAGPLIALFDKSDKYYKKTKDKLQHYRRFAYGRLVTTWPIITETAYLLKVHVHLQAQLDFLEWISLDGVEIFELQKSQLLKIIELQNKYSDLPMDFADATLIIAAEVLDINNVFSLDKDFSIYRILGKKHLKNLLND